MGGTEEMFIGLAEKARRILRTQRAYENMKNCGFWGTLTDRDVVIDIV